MKFFVVALFVFCLAASAFAAKYSADTRSNFLIGCLSGADRSACDCVLQKLESRYSETEFKRVQNQVLAGKTDPKYADFLAKKRRECGIKDSPAVQPTSTSASSAGKVPASSSTQANLQPAKISAADMMLLQMLLNNQAFKDSFVVECTKEGDKFLGAAQSQKSCQCAYDNMLQNDSLLYLLMRSMNANGEVTDFEKLSYRLILPCLPAQFTPEMEAFLQKACLESVRAGNKTRCACAVKEIKKSFTIQELLQDILLDQEKFRIKLVGKVGKCVAP